MYREAAELAAEAAAEPEETERKRKSDVAEGLLVWGRKSESRARIEAMIKLAESRVGIPVLPAQLDTDPWLLNVQNGTINLRTGNLQAHQRADLITKLAPVNYDPSAKCPQWEKFLERIMANKPGLIRFLKRATGYTLTGDVSEDCLFVAYGPGRNGKSVFLETLLGLWGDYGHKCPPELLMVKRGEAHPTERTVLFGVRFAPAIETSEGQRLNESLVKELTGGDTISARRMREDFWEFLPTHHLWLATNHKPIIKGTDLGIWSRMRLIPFSVTIPPQERDKRLRGKLKTEWPGILAWAVQGCLDWQQNGLQEPSEVLQATSQYRDEMDVLEDFLAEYCVQKSDAQVKAQDIYAAYQGWAQKSGERAISKTGFGQRLEERGFRRGRGGHGVRLWLGIGLIESLE